MSWKLPPLNAIRTFEVAARHSSFTRAADELCVTPGAISRQIRGLEDYLGKPLFDRNYREVRLSPESRTYADELFAAFARIDQATRNFAGAGREQKLRVFAPITFALRWLMPRMAAWHARFPSQGISISSQGLPPVDLEADGFDVAIRIAGPARNLDGERLFDIELVPVCSPEFLEANHLEKVSDLSRVTLLHSIRRQQDWHRWLESCRQEQPDSFSELTFESSSMAYQAALSGLGVAMAMRVLIEDDLSTGRLVEPFTHHCMEGTAFHVIYPQTARSEDSVVGFVDWIREEAAKYRRTEPMRLAS